MCEKVLRGGSGVETEGVRRWYVCGQGNRVSSSFLKVRKGWDSQTQRLSLGWRDSSFSVATGEDQLVFRSDARTFIKLILVFSVNGSQFDGLRDAGNLNTEETDRIHSLENE